MDFKTTLSIEEISRPQHYLNYNSKVLLMGSCFVENIGGKMTALQFDTFLNPYGVLFHPLAIVKALHDMVYQRTYTAADLIFNQGLWHSLHHHSDFSHTDSEIVLEKINTQISIGHQFLKHTTHAVFTLGTAWVYHHIPSDTLVANCHKIPQKQFIKRLLTSTEIETGLRNISDLLLKINPEIQIIWTLSPVRHLKDGMQNNAWSKALLLQALHKISEEKNSVYFPAYEIMSDDLRDYRFYNADMVHPSDVAVQYIWTFFEKTHFTSETQHLMAEVVQVLKDEAHRPFHPESEAHLAFLKRLEERKKLLWKRIRNE